MADTVKGVEIDPVREKLVELIFKSLCMHIYKSCELAENIADDLIADGVTGQEWISVKDRLPEDDPTVKKHIEGEKFGFLTVLVYNGVVKETNRFFSNEPRYGLPKTNGWEWASSNVTHWMPLPQPPKGE